MNKALKVIIIQKTYIKKIKIDHEQLQQCILQVVTQLQHNLSEGLSLLLGVEDTKIGYKLKGMPNNYTKAIPALKLTVTAESELPPNTEDTYMVEVDAAEPLAKDVNQENLKIMKAHYGYTEITPKTQVFVIPVDVTVIRPEAINEIGNPIPSIEKVRTLDPAAEKLEKKFMQALKKKANINLSRINKALDTIKRYHYHQKRKSGEPFYTHPVEVAYLLLSYTQDQTTLIVALLHDIVEDTQLSLPQVKAEFGTTISQLIDCLSNLNGDLQKIKLNDYEQIVKIQKSNDKRVLQIKLADRLHNLRTIASLSVQKQQKKAEETLYFYVPVAKSMGFIPWADELKEHALKILNKIA